MKILLQETNYKEVEMEMPFYAYIDEMEKEIYVRIDEKEFKQITFHAHGKIEFFKSKTHGTLAAVWFKNKSNENTWNEALKFFKEVSSKF